jgi:hypothetical protein
MESIFNFQERFKIYIMNTYPPKESDEFYELMNQITKEFYNRNRIRPKYIIKAYFLAILMPIPFFITFPFKAINTKLLDFYVRQMSF